MRTRIRALATALAVLGTAWAAAGPATANDREQTLEVVFAERQEISIDVGPVGATVGDYYLFAERLENRRGRTTGNVYGRCTTHFDAMEMCEGVFDLNRRGLISVQTAFPADFSEPVVLAVTGGTGRFQTVRGEGHFTQFPNGRFGVVFHLLS